MCQLCNLGEDNEEVTALNGLPSFIDVKGQKMHLSVYTNFFHQERFLCVCYKPYEGADYPNVVSFKHVYPPWSRYNEFEHWYVDRIIDHLKRHNFKFLNK